MTVKVNLKQKNEFRFFLPEHEESITILGWFTFCLLCLYFFAVCDEFMARILGVPLW